MKNHGIIEGARPEDFRAGALEFEVVNPTGDWTPYLPQNERQRNRTTETMACVSYSALNCIETQIKYLTGYEYNFSDRFLAKVSGTTRSGNWLYKVADALRKVGVVPQEDWAEPENYTWDTYYAEIPPDVYAKAQDFLNNYEVSYEWLSFPPTKEELTHHLRHAPLQIVIPGHAIMQFNQEDDIIKYLDHYEPYLRERKKLPSSALKLVVKLKENMKLTKEQVKRQYILMRHVEPTEQEIEYWSGRELDEFQIVMMKDDAKLLNNNAK